MMDNLEEKRNQNLVCCHLKRISSEEKRRKEYIAQIKKEHHKANHSCSAIIVGDDGQIKSKSGEPSGTLVCIIACSRKARTY